MTHAIDAPESTLSGDKASESIFSQLIKGSDNDGYSKGINFKMDLLNTKVYDKAFRGNLYSTGDHSDDALTVIDIGSVKHETEPVAGEMASTHDVNADVLNLAINALRIRPSILSLGIRNIFALAVVDYTAGSDGELNLKWNAGINDIQQLARSKYYGQLELNSEDVSGLWGRFDHDKVQLQYHLRQPLEVRTLASCDIPLGVDCYTYDKGEKLKIRVSLYVPILAHRI
jgi:hypothetical protein